MKQEMELASGCKKEFREKWLQEIFNFKIGEVVNPDQEHLITRSMVWSSTPQGHRFWWEVYNNYQPWSLKHHEAIMVNFRINIPHLKEWA